ncbi:hypothetical protein MSG28_012266 [Choristoneura fumiferana]|uniref:Uncharacterized protein n=1 Tax=Choristoneura fumiferana TaxID=7141 RepID=A0ACC0KD63_CHOFU|nr:hypothetical protein MSG28_012266 [Choristoneura fumiferana]
MKRGNYRSSSLTDLISAFDTKANSHTALQKVTAFSGQFDKNIKPTFSKEEYGKPIPGSMTEFRGAEAQARIYTVISDKLVGILLRTRKHHLTFFEGEVLFQVRKKDTYLPI